MTARSGVVGPRREDDPGAAHGAHGAESGVNTALLGMLLFIGSEAMFFAALFGAYFNSRAQFQHWPPPIHPGETEFHLDLVLPVIVTAILVISSLTMQWAVWRIRAGDRTGMNRALIVTLLLGVVFLFLQVYDYAQLLGEGLRINRDIFGTLFYTLTGFHGAHVFGGVVGIAVILSRGLAGQFSARHHVAVEAVSIYWHFVDVIWILLFLTIYILQ